MILPSGTLSQTLDVKNFASVCRSLITRFNKIYIALNCKACNI